MTTQRKFSPYEKQVVALQLRTGRTLADVAKQLGRTYASVQRHALRRKLKALK